MAMELTVRLQELRLRSASLLKREAAGKLNLAQKTPAGHDNMDIDPKVPTKKSPGEEILSTNFPRNMLFTLGGLPVLSYAPSDHALRLRESARSCALKSPDMDRYTAFIEETQRLGGLDNPGAQAWWVEFYGYDPCPSSEFRTPLDTLQDFFAEMPTQGVTALVVGGEVYTGQEVRAAVAYLASQASLLPNLKALYIGEIDDEGRLCDSSPVDLALLLHAFPCLEELSVCIPGGAVFSAGTAHGCLRKLTVYDNTLDPQTLLGLSACWFPTLEQLNLWVGGESILTDEGRERYALRCLFAGNGLSSLTRLGLRNITFSDDVLKILAESRLMDQLRCLDLSWTLVTEKGFCAVMQGFMDRSRLLDLDELIVSRDRVMKGDVKDVCRSFGLLGVAVSFV